MINNAVDAIGENSGEIRISTSIENDLLVIVISDTGRGVPPEILDKIFLPFFTTKDVGKGTGLGLSVSYGIVKNLGGKIEVNSILGQGTAFTISLPLKLS
jgi:two-component system NtrC family sensor kinase